MPTYKIYYASQPTDFARTPFDDEFRVKRIDVIDNNSWAQDVAEIKGLYSLSRFVFGKVSAVGTYAYYRVFLPVDIQGDPQLTQAQKDELIATLRKLDPLDKVEQYILPSGIVIGSVDANGTPLNAVITRFIDP